MSSSPAPAPAPGRGRRAWRMVANVLMALLWVFVLVRLAPHLAAIVGVETGERETPAFQYRLLDGGTLSSEDLRGRVVLVNFWATWCTPCRVEMPLLQAMADRHREQGLVVLGLSRDLGSPEGVRTFLLERDITYPVAIVGKESETSFGGVRGYPTSFLLDREGRIRHRALGPLAMISFEPAVRRLLAEPPPAP